MTISRRKKNKQFELDLRIVDDEFIAPPSEQQRTSILNKLMAEFEENLRILDRNASDFVSAETETFLEDRTDVELTDDEIMEDWQMPLMEAMAETLCSVGDDILEIGFGRGVASGFIQDQKPANHTIVECNPKIFPRMNTWKEDYPDCEITFVEGLWQDVLDDLGKFDGVFFHTYPLNSDEYMKYVVGRSTFAEHFFEPASEHLNDGGAFVYMTNEVDSLSRGQQVALFRHFSTIETKIIDLKLNESVRDSWWSNQMAVVKATK